MTYSAPEWLEQFAAILGVASPSPAEIDDLLGLAGTAAHVSERTAAPVSCWLVAKAGMSPAEGRARADELARALGN
ncbi:MAG: DUF6457 domain-containing protein [Acidimicrobiales bacterium]